MFFLTTAVLALSVLAEAHLLPLPAVHKPTRLDNVTAAFEKAHIVPDVLPSFSPKIGVGALFTDSVTRKEVEVIPGILLTMQQTAQPPQWSLASDDKQFSSSSTTWVVTIVDPDAPTPQNPNISQFLHFIGGNFVVDNSHSHSKGRNAVRLKNVTNALVDFFPPSPPAGSDPHRYVILVYVQPHDFEETGLAYFNGTAPSEDQTREHFSITDFAAKTSLGKPIAGNFFLVGPDADAST